MKNVVIGTAGHIDHGKSTLIKALTGIETDTSQEEKKRGLSINLGFAYLDLPRGGRVGIVDVPGHEKFIKNMLAGAAGIDLVLLAIDANEGVMPQTREHVDVLTLLGVENYIIVLTKVSGVDEDLKALVYEDIMDQFQGTPLAEAPVVETDALSGLGLDQLLDTIQDQVDQMEELHGDLPARLNVDRSFSVKGFGTVVTGTLIDGSVKVGDELTIYPGELTTRIRTIQIHEEAREEAHAGNRTALNLTKVDLGDVGRGDVLSASPLDLSYMLDAKVKCLDSAWQPMELWDRVHVHIGTREVVGRLVPLGQEKILPGESAFMQIRMEDQVAVKKGDRFILRNFSPVVTIGGGEVLDPNPKKHKRFDEDMLADLKVLESGSLADILLNFLENRSAGFSSVKEMADYMNVEMSQIHVLLDELMADHKLIQFGPFYMAQAAFDRVANAMVQLLADYHQANNMESGMALEEFRSRFNKIPPKELNAIIQALRDQEVIAIEDELIRLASFQVEISPQQAEARQAIMAAVEAAAWAPLSFDEIVGKDPVKREVYLQMRKDGEFYRLDREVELHRSLYNEALDRMADHIGQHGEIALADFRNLLDTSRKYALLLLDNFDDRGITDRVEDVRVLKPDLEGQIEKVYV